MRRAIVIGSVVLLVVSIAGFITSLVLNAFVLDDYIGSTSGGGLPIPDLSVTIDPPPGVAQPQLVENIGATTTVNNDAASSVSCHGLSAGCSG